MSLQVSILKILASHPDGRASYAALKRDLMILAGAGAAWAERLKRIAARHPELDIFSQKLVLRDADGWQLTVAGRAALAVMDVPIPAEDVAVVAAKPVAVPKLTVVARAVPRPSAAPQRPAGFADRRRLPRRAL